MCPLTVDYSWGYTMPCKEHYSYTWTKGYAYSIFEDTLNLKTVTVRDRIDDGDGKYHYEVNKNETMFASGT